jgi:alpha-galactosidase
MSRMTAVDFNKGAPPEQVISASSLTINLPLAPRLFYRHGWQSWSLAAWTNTDRPLPIQKPKLLHAMQHDPNYAYHPRPHGSWVGAIETEEGNVLLLGSLGLDAHVELDSNRLHGWYESGTKEWFIGYGTEQTVFARYAELLGQRLGTAMQRPAPRVWCSWYSLYTAINELVLYKAFDDLSDLPFDVFQVDDGWQAAVGDWEANGKFPSGMTALADKIKLTGRKAGLWLAPFIAVKSSRIFREHSNWFLKDQKGKFVSAGFNWGEHLYAIDTTYPEALNWLSKLMKQVRRWGFDYVKLDFLYGGALPGKRNVDMPREAAYRKGMKVLREALGENTFFLACGAPILPSLGVCDALRIGPDVAAGWENTRNAVLLYNPTIPGTKNAIRTTVHRLWLKPLVRADPDVVYFRSRECKLTENQKSALQDLALICNFRATSDLPQWLTHDERERLRVFLQVKPKVTQSSRYIFQVENRTVDFNSAMPLPEPPKGIDLIKSILLSWLGDRSWALRIMDNIQKNSLLKKTKRL